ncbi:NAD kinase [uncultured archaeon]|nr:NAD kinase [uncultured archaeon]
MLKAIRYDLLGFEKDVKPVEASIARHSLCFRHDQDDPEIHIVVGGDGTIQAKEVKKRILDGKPVLPVHNRDGSRAFNSKKSLGFVADVTLDNLHVALEDIAQGRSFPREERLLACSINSEMKGTAICDIAIKSSNPFSTILFAAVVLKADDKKLERPPSPKCDILLASTKYGSTAWNLSMGGPINVDVPNCMQLSYGGASIKHAHFLYSTRDVIKIELCADTLVSIDGITDVHEGRKGDLVEITGSEDFIKLLRTDRTFESLNSKIGRQIQYSHNSIMSSALFPEAAEKQ